MSRVKRGFCLKINPRMRENQPKLGVGMGRGWRGDIRSQKSDIRCQRVGVGWGLEREFKVQIRFG